MKTLINIIAFILILACISFACWQVNSLCLDIEQRRAELVEPQPTWEEVNFGPADAHEMLTIQPD